MFSKFKSIIYHYINLPIIHFWKNSKAILIDIPYKSAKPGNCGIGCNNLSNQPFQSKTESDQKNNSSLFVSWNESKEPYLA